MSYYASYYKCALQVNPYCYAEYRGEGIEDEDIYNQGILQKCKENNISIVGLANHGNVDSSEKLRDVLRNQGIIVFPGFEIMSAEKIHMVCLFPEDKTISELNRYLGGMGLNNLVRGNETSSKTCLQIAEQVEEIGGFWYAAHITGDNGILKLGKMNDIWKSDKLVAAQIPDSRENVDPKYKNILNNTDPQYKRTSLPALINACDIDKPEDLEKNTATTLIKMSEPTFENFVMAFKDPISRIRLNSEIEQGYQSCLKSLVVTGRYLDDFRVDFSDNLITIIGGRGTGKSTIINLIRYCLDLAPVDLTHKKEYEQMIDSNLGSGGKVELIVASNSRYGQSFKIIRRYKSNPVIEDMNGVVSDLTVSDILPNIEIYGQNEIVDTVRNVTLTRKIVSRLFNQDLQLESQIEDAYKALKCNSGKLEHLENDMERDENEIADLPALKEKLKYYQKAGLEDKLEVVKKISTQEAKILEFNSKIMGLGITWPSIDYLCEDEELKELVSLAEEFNGKIRNIEKEYNEALSELKRKYKEKKKKWEINRGNYDEEIRNSVKDIQGINDKQSSEIIEDYRKLVKKVQMAEPIQIKRDERNKNIEILKKERKTLIENCRKCRDEHANNINKQLKRLNKKKLNNSVRLSVEFHQQKDILLDKLKKIQGIGDKAICGIYNYKEFDVFDFADDVREGLEHLKQKYSLTDANADKIVKNLNEKDLREIEEYMLSDIFKIELYVNGEFKAMENLSKGQQCTAILNILLLDNKDPLIIDQPEDNLDNSFIADNLINSIRENKIRRQYIFATHNANIPVFGDAELIIALEEVDGQGRISEGGIGSIDSNNVKGKVINILEGGEAAFRMREKSMDYRFY